MSLKTAILSLKYLLNCTSNRILNNNNKQGVSKKSKHPVISYKLEISSQCKLHNCTKYCRNKCYIKVTHIFGDK